MFDLFFNRGDRTGSQFDERSPSQKKHSSRLSNQEYIEITRYSNGERVSVEIISLPQSTKLTAKAESDILPEQTGRVSYQGTSWQAYCCGTTKIAKGEQVIVLERKSLTLYVVAASQSLLAV